MKKEFQKNFFSQYKFLVLPFEESGGGSDANQFNSYGIPTVVLGVGMTDCHTVQETILEKDLYDSARLALGIITEAVNV